MDKLIYTAMSGAKADLARQDVLANNLANVNTPGYRAQGIAFRYVPVQSDDTMNSRAMTVESTPGADFSPGPIHRTGNSLDVAVNGPGWIAVQPDGGGEAYTRNGSFQLSSQGVLETQRGLPVLGDGGPITVPPDSAVSIATDGTVTAVPFGSNAKTPVPIGKIKLVNPPDSSMTRGDDGLFRTTSGTADVDSSVVLAPESVEGSNVNPVQALVDMISLARQFELHMKMISNVESNSQKASQLLSVDS